MYRRYTPSPMPEKSHQPTNGGNRGAGQNVPPANHNNYRQGSRPPQGTGYNSRRGGYTPHQSLPPMPVRERKEKEQKKGKPGGKNPRSLLFGLLPPSIYNRENKKILGFLSSEDLLLVALIFLFLEREDEDQTIILVLLYILLSDHIDLPFDF